ncbi:hypothetical protein HMPREF9141_2692 [Prevotella multiformis DSM 16608]|uniref:Uncharacterized protein n=1 Tax=Prevotella multiformis DSM 16608 TaxID=888743 RepID=F0FAS5_9BACT|nr:hypothetical protein HMPREF9141_2692 [Prevotella multiformis DSM 16608]
MQTCNISGKGSNFARSIKESGGQSPRNFHHGGRPAEACFPEKRTGQEALSSLTDRTPAADTAGHQTEQK